MFECDMWLCQAYPDIRRSLISDLWSTKNVTPLFDTLDNMFNNHIEFDESTGMQIFTFSRAMDTGDKEQDFVVEIDQEIKICFALNMMTPDFMQNTDWGLFKITYNRDGTIALSSISTGHDNFVFHGLVMYTCWFWMGFFLLATKRYFRANWRIMHLIHIILGTTTFLVTTYFGLKIIEYFAWNVHPDYHQIMGCVLLVTAGITSIVGISCVIIQHFYNGDKPWSDYDRARYLAGWHAYMGYGILALGNATVMSGVINYVQKQIKQNQYTYYAMFTMPLFILIVIGFEANHRLKDRKGILNFTMPKGKPLMSMKEFHEWVKAGKQLVVIDNLILDQGSYSDVHPGGKFSIRHTVGRDISKYFYGGFSLLNPEIGRPPYQHSLKALSIAESFVCAVV